MIDGGTASNIAARDCTFSGEMRILPGESVAGWKARVLAEAARLEADDARGPPRRLHPHRDPHGDAGLPAAARAAPPSGSRAR